MSIFSPLVRELRIRGWRMVVRLAWFPVLFLAYVSFFAWFQTINPGSTYYISAFVYYSMAMFVGWRLRYHWQTSGGWVMGRMTALFRCPEGECTERLELGVDRRDDVLRYAHRHLKEVHRIENPAYLPVLRNEGDDLGE